LGASIQRLDGSDRRAGVCSTLKTGYPTGTQLSTAKWHVDECIGGDKRPIFLNRTNVKSLDVAQVGDTLYYFSAGFLTFRQSEFTSCLSAGRPLLKLECRVAARVSLLTGLRYQESVVRCRGGMWLAFSSYRGVSGW